MLEVPQVVVRVVVVAESVAAVLVFVLPRTYLKLIILKSFPPAYNPSHLAILQSK